MINDGSIHIEYILIQYIVMFIYIVMFFYL
jgi:hypothetical protein